MPRLLIMLMGVRNEDYQESGSDLRPRVLRSLEV